MIFVDGENFTLSAQRWAQSQGIEIPTGPFFLPNVYLWLPTRQPEHIGYDAADNSWQLHLRAERAYYYTSVLGDAQKIEGVEDRLRHVGFAPVVFKKTKTRGSKGVDLSIAKDMLSHAFDDNYDVALLAAGDGDYVPVVEEVQRRGKGVLLVACGQQDLSPRLRRVADGILDLSADFAGAWRDPVSNPPYSIA